jgi:threonine dehydrogenase-like Zn-dependent dehydrogenase
MKGLWLEDGLVSYREEIPVPDIPAGEAMVRLRLAGICTTDLELVRGYYPFTGVLGHEFVGEVIEAPGADSLVSRRVVGEINSTCGSCVNCLAGRPTHCENRTVLGIVHRNGVFAEYFTLPVKNLHLVPDHLTDDAAVFTEPLAAALEIQQQLQIHPTDRILLVGAGRLGQLVAQCFTNTGCDLRVLARYPNQQKILNDQQIRVIREEDIPSARMDIVVEATGSSEGFKIARRAVRPRGTIVLKSTYKGEMRVNFSSMVVDEINLVGSRCGPFEPALGLLASGKVNIYPLIDSRFNVSDGGKALQHAAQPGVLKVLLSLA